MSTIQDYGLEIGDKIVAGEYNGEEGFCSIIPGDILTIKDEDYFADCLVERTGTVHVYNLNRVWERYVEKNSYTTPSLANKKIWVKDLTEEQKKRIQDVAFEQGFSWSGDNTTYKYLNATSYFTDTRDNTITYSSSYYGYVEEHRNEEITYDQIFGESLEESDEYTILEMSSRLVPMVKVLQERCQKANVQVLTRSNSFTIYSEEDEREIICNTEEELFDILDQLVTIQEMSEKIGWTF